MVSMMIGVCDCARTLRHNVRRDPRTPITRMRLRAEFIEDKTHCSRMLGDLDQMHSMLESVLSFLRNGRRGDDASTSKTTAPAFQMR